MSFGWDSELEFHEMWKPYELPISEALHKVEEAEAQGLVRVGTADVLVSVASVELTLCHESDLHLKGEGSLFQAIAARWEEAGLAPSEVTPSNFKWPGKG
ncbi:MAG: hypothetical protein LXA50_14280 [Betaproteobacteria bacterium]|nr:hypothetical protein [Betaproteobacteria bacterium]